MKKHSLRKAINNYCKQCIHDPSSAGTWRLQVEQCTAPGCALYPVRPVSNYHKDEALEAQNESLKEDFEKRMLGYSP